MSELGVAELALAIRNGTAGPDDGGLGTYLRTFGVVTPTGNASTDRQRWAGVLAAGKVLMPKPGSHVIGSAISLPDFAMIRAIGNARLVSTLTSATGDPGNAPLVAVDGLADLSGSTTISGGNTPNTNTLAVTAAAGALAAGTWAGYYRDNPTYILVADDVSGSGFRGGTFRVQSVAATTVTLCSPCRWQFGAGDHVKVRARVPRGITLEGLTLSGTGDRLIEFIGTMDCEWRGLSFDPVDGWPSDAAASWDTFGLNNVGTDCVADNGSGLGTDGLYLETQTDSHLIRCTSTRMVGKGFVVFDSAGCSVQDGIACYNDSGLGITSDGNTLGCIDFKLVRGTYNNNASIGVTVVNGSTGTKFTDVCARFNPTGVDIGDGGAGTTSDTEVQGRFDGSTVAGIVVHSNATRTTLKSVDTSNSARGINVSSGADVFASGWVHRGTTAAYPNGNCLISAGTFRAKGVTLAPTTAIDVIALTGGRCEIRGGSVTGGGGSNLINCQSGSPTLYIDATLSVGGGGTGIPAAAGSSVFRYGNGADLTACAVQTSGAGTFKVSAFA
jgi:hypothetical protein